MPKGNTQIRRGGVTSFNDVQGKSPWNCHKYHPKYKWFLNWMQKFTIESSLKIYKKFKKSWINIVLIQQQIFSPIHFHWNLLCHFFAFYLWYWFIDKLITQIWISCMKYIIIEYKRKRWKWDTKYIFKFYSRFVTAKMICNKIWHMRQMLYLTIF